MLHTEFAPVAGLLPRGLHFRLLSDNVCLGQPNMQ